MKINHFKISGYKVILLIEQIQVNEHTPIVKVGF